MKSPSFPQSLRHAVAGMVEMLRRERNARIHAVLAVLVAGLATWLDIGRWHGALLVGAIGAVFAAEAFNTSIEALVDLVSPDRHESARIAKDVAAAGVLCSAVAALVVGLLVLGPPLWERLAH